MGKEKLSRWQVFLIMPFCSKEFTGRNIEKSNSTGSLSEMNGSQEVIFFIVQNIIIDRNTGSNQFGNTTLHQLLRHFGVFQLVTDSDTLSGTNQFRKISVESMMRESRHLNSLSFPGVSINDNVLNYKENNFLAAVHFGKASCGVATLKKNLFRGKVIQQLVYIIKRSFCSKEFTGRNIEKSNSTGSLLII